MRQLRHPHSTPTSVALYAHAAGEISIFTLPQAILHSFTPSLLHFAAGEIPIPDRHSH